MVYSPPLVNDKISDASGGEKFWDLKWAETFKNEVFGAEGAEFFWGPEIMVYSPLVNDNLSTRGGINHKNYSDPWPELQQNFSRI